MSLTEANSHTGRNGKVCRRRIKRPIECNFCNIPFKTFKRLHEHTQTIHEEYGCTICGQIFKCLVSLQKHSMRHLPYAPYQCKICDEFGNTKRELVKHLEMKHPGVSVLEGMETIVQPCETLEFLNLTSEEWRTFAESLLPKTNKYDAAIAAGLDEISSSSDEES